MQYELHTRTITQIGNRIILVHDFKLIQAFQPCPWLAFKELLYIKISYRLN
jgi:hypothetical protein